VVYLGFTRMCDTSIAEAKAEEPRQWTPEFCDWAFNYERGLPAERMLPHLSSLLALIPRSGLVNAIPLTDILSAPSPPPSAPSSRHPNQAHPRPTARPA
jgi:hypothetical protein